MCDQLKEIEERHNLEFPERVSWDDKDWLINKVRELQNELKQWDGYRTPDPSREMKLEAALEIADNKLKQIAADKSVLPQELDQRPSLQIAREALSEITEILEGLDVK